MGVMTTQPVAPYLIIRKGVAFWVEDNPPGSCSARLQAFREGCYHEASCYDETGGLWPVLDARLKGRPSLFDRISTTNWVPVELGLGARCEIDLQEILSHVAEVLEGESEFCEHLPEPADALLRRLAAASTPRDVIRVAREHAG